MACAGDIRGLGLPFVIGTALGAAIFQNFQNHGFALAMAAFIIFACFLSFKSPKSLKISFLTTFIFFLTGIFCSINSSFTSMNMSDSVSGNTAMAAIKSVIDNIPYPSGTSAPLVKALLTGDKSELSKETVEIFRSSGASHILSLSGLHLGIIYLILMKLALPLGLFRKGRTARSIFIILACGFYVRATGASSSLVRAFIFIFLNEAARMLERKVRPKNLLAASATVQLAMKPSSIASISFQLSYSAILGIFLIFPFLRSLYPQSGKRDPIRWIWESASLSISCQAFTAPLAWHYFHSFPKYFLLANLIALPLTSAIMILSVATIALSSIGICPYFLVILNDKAIQAIIFCLRVISEM
jgi:ComEC/Rec2-related protein